MKTVYYSRTKLVFLAICAALFAWGCAWLFANHEGKAAFAGAITAPFMAFGVAFALRYLADNRIVEIGESSLRFHGLLGARTLRYAHIVSIDIETTSVNFIRQRHLAIKTVDQNFGKTRIAEKLLEKRAGKLEGILDLISHGPEEAEPHVRAARRLEPAGQANPARPSAQRGRSFGKKVV